MTRPWLLLPLLAACNTESTLPVYLDHFDPASGHTFVDDGPTVSIINLDDQDFVCYALNAEVDWNGGDCEGKLTDTRDIVLDTCGFTVLNIAWGDGTQTDAANYQVEAPSCEDECAPVVPWSNDELARAFATWQDETRCMMNDCKDPSGTGNWDTSCDSGSIDWNVSLDGLRAISAFTFNACEHTVEIEVHDWEADPDGTDESAVTTAPVTLVVSGELVQDTDFSGNGNEAGTVEISGDFEGSLESRVVIEDKVRGGGDFRAACSVDPYDNEDCAPGNAAIAYDYPGWTCHGDICPEAAPGDCEEDIQDADEDGIPDEDDNCPDTPNTDQADVDNDGIGDECDDEAGFVVIQFKTSERCLTLGADGAVESSSVCAAADPTQQWVMFEDGSHFGFMSLSNGECLSQDGVLIGPWDVVTAPCDGSEEQQWDLETYDQGGLDEQWPLRLHNVADNFCAYTDFTGWVYGTIANCDLLGTQDNRKVGIYLNGDFTTTPYSPE